VVRAVVKAVVMVVARAVVAKARAAAAKREGGGGEGGLGAVHCPSQLPVQPHGRSHAPSQLESQLKVPKPPSQLSSGARAAQREDCEGATSARVG
jgi:hypothetical protein